MDENKTDQTYTEEQPKQEKKRSKALRILLRVLTVILTLLLVLAGVLLVLNRNQINLDSIKRYLTYQALERSDDGKSAEYEISNEDGTLFAALDDSLIACTGNRILLYSDNGSVYVDMEISMSDPIVASTGDYGLVYDAGGSQLYLFSKRQLVFQYETKGSYELISAQINQNGWLAVVEQASGYKGAVTVYDANHEAVVTENISSSFVMDAAVSPDNSRLAVLTVGQQDLDFASTVTTYTVSNGTQTAAAIVADCPVLQFQWDGNGFWLQKESGVSLYGTDGQQIGQWEDTSLYLRGCTLDGDNFAVEYFSRSRAGFVGQLLVVNSAGEAAASIDIGEQVLSVTAAGRYIAVLTVSGLTVYTSDLTEYAHMDNDGTLLQALARTDGTVVLVTAQTASVYLP